MFLSYFLLVDNSPYQHIYTGAPARTVGWRDPGFIHTSFLKALWPNSVYDVFLFLLLMLILGMSTLKKFRFLSQVLYRGLASFLLCTSKHINQFIIYVLISKSDVRNPFIIFRFCLTFFVHNFPFWPKCFGNWNP